MTESLATDRIRDLLELRRTTLFDVDDAHRMLVGNDDSGSTQLYEISADGEWRQLTDLGEPCHGRYLPGRRAVVVSADTGGTERAQLSLLPLDGSGLQPLAQDPAYIHQLLDVQPDRVVYMTNRRNGVDFDVVSHEVSTGTERVLWDGGGYFSEAAVSPDARWIVLSRMTLIAASSELLLVDTASGEVVPITDATVAGQWANPQWLADSSAFLASSDADDEFVSLRRFEVTGRSWTTLASCEHGDVSGWPAPDGHRLAVVETVDGADQLRITSLDGPATGDAVELPHPGMLTFRASPIWSPDSGLLGLTFNSPVQPPEVYSWTSGAEAERRTTSNPHGATAHLVQPSVVRVPTPDGEQIPAFVITPTNADGSAVLIIHGGPEAASWRMWNPVASALALAGHTVVLPNVRGSSGYGRRWVSLDDIELRLDSVTDLVALRDWLPTLDVDVERVALYGGSYGGYMVLAGLTFHPELWAAGVDIVGMSSLVTFMQNTSAYRRAYREREYGRLVEDFDVLQAASPLPQIDRITAPLFVIHGANDPRVPLSEAEQVVAAVRSNGAECQLLVYPDEGHGLAKRANQLDAYPQALAFLARHLSA